MAEYIERAETAEFFEKSKQTMWHKDDIAATISSKKNILSADVVEVVRCKDCKHYKFGKHFTDIKFCQRLPYYAEKGGLNTSDNDYCSYGERKSEECE